MIAMGAPSKRARKIRSRDEFDTRRLMIEVQPPKTALPVYAWSLEDIYSAREEQMRGRFKLPVRLAESMRTDDALAVAYENRLAPQRCIPVELKPGKGARGVSVAGEGDALFGQNGIGLRVETLNDITGCLVNHGLAIGCNVQVPRGDGSRVDFFHKAWPLEWVWWDPTDLVLKTQTLEGIDEPIVHGDGRWVIYRKHEIDPWKQEAALLPGALVWARHAFALRDWSKGSVAHGNAKVIGEMPVGVALQDKNGALTPEAKAFVDLLRQIATGDAPIGIRPAGSKVEFVANNSTAWQVWNELVLNAEKAAARIYLGTDGVLGANGGAPGVDIGALFGVAATKVEGDLTCIERAVLTGIIEPWTAINFGDSSNAPMRKYLVPDGDEAARHDARSKRETAFHAAVKSARENGFDVTPAYVAALAKEYDVTVPMDENGMPLLKSASPPATSSPPAPAPPKADAAPPQLRLVPPPATSRSFAERNAAFLADCKDYEQLGFEIDQARIEKLAQLHDVPVPKKRASDA